MRAVATLPSFGRGIRETRIVRVGTEFAVLYVCSGRVVGGRTHEELESAIAVARIASDPPEHEDEDGNWQSF